jgi:hypothetical protein
MGIRISQKNVTAITATKFRLARVWQHGKPRIYGNADLFASHFFGAEHASKEKAKSVQDFASTQSVGL